MKRLTFVMLLLPFAVMPAPGQSPSLPDGQSQVRHLLFRLERQGLLPASAAVEEGWWLVRLSNGHFVQDMEVRIDNEQGASLSVRRTIARRSRTSSLVYLRPGRHTLQISGAEKWKAQIQVRPKK